MFEKKRFFFSCHHVISTLSVEMKETILHIKISKNLFPNKKKIKKKLFTTTLSIVSYIKKNILKLKRNAKFSQIKFFENKFLQSTANYTINSLQVKFFFLILAFTVH